MLSKSSLATPCIYYPLGVNSKRRRWIFLEIIKAYGQKTRKVIIALKMTLHWHEGHSMIYSFRIILMRGSWMRCICLELQGHGFKHLWRSKLVVFLWLAKSYYLKLFNYLTKTRRSYPMDMVLSIFSQETW
jgi:hypothetical protein